MTLPVRLAAAFAAAAILSPAAAETNPDTSLEINGWTVSAGAGREVLSVSHSRLGAVLGEVRLRAQTGAFTRWTVEKAGGNQLRVRTAQPRSTWLFEVQPASLRISCTSTGAFLTGRAAAPPGRSVARLLDPHGIPVEWKGTAEVRVSYGGSETVNPSFLPRENPEVMYFRLGQVSASTFHSLFDGTSDTAIDFPEGAVLGRAFDISIPVPGNALIRIVPDYYTRTLGLPDYAPFDDSAYPRAPVVWSSWTSYYADVTEADIVRNTDWLAQNLKPYGFEFVQLDDGYDRGPKGEHYWIENWDRVKFPHGPRWLAEYIRSKGLRAGLWIVPNAYAGAVEAHPDWYLRDRSGNFILDYHTPALDSTHPEVQAFLRKLFSTLDGWGFDYYKFDGEHALPRSAPQVDRAKLHDPAIDPLVAYRQRLALIRETIGPNRFIEGCPAGTPLNGPGYFNSYFNGDDLYNNWQGMYALFSSINANAFLNRVAAYLMPGEGLEVGPPITVEEASRKRHPSVVRTARTREAPLTGFGVTAAEARTLVTYLALTGVVYPLASVMPELPEERVRMLKATMPPMPIAPIDLFSRGTDMTWDRFKHVQADDYIHNYPEILDLKVNAASGVYDVAGLTNWRSWPAKRALSFAGKLGLGPGPYVVFDYWNQKPLGVFRDGMEIDIAPHDTRVLLIHPLQMRPQLIGISRHVTGAFSIVSQAWDASRNALGGVSQGVPGDPYTLWIAVPAGWTVSRVEAAAAGHAVAVTQEPRGTFVAVRFDGQSAPVEWRVSFATTGH